MASTQSRPAGPQNRDYASKDGKFHRQVSTFRNWIEPGGEFPPEDGRYRLYVSKGCPWAHRTLIARKLKGLENIVDLSVVYPFLLEKGWSFEPPPNEPPFDRPEFQHLKGVIPDTQYEVKTLKELYLKADPDYPARFTVPVLWDTKKHTIVNNESSEIIRIFNEAFDEFVAPEYKGISYYPEELRTEIDALNEWVYNEFSNGVYKAGFATTQEAYDDAVYPVFEALARLDSILAENQSKGHEYLIGGRLTEADIRTYTTAARFDVAYHSIFKCNLGMIRTDYPHVHRWLRNLYWNNSAFQDTTDWFHIKNGYLMSMVSINPTRVVPAGPKEPILPF